MPTLRKLDAAQFAVVEKKDSQRRAIELEYDVYLAEFGAGEFGEAELSEGDTKPNVRNRLRAAAKRRGLEIEFFRVRDENIVRFKLLGDARLDLEDDAELDKLRVGEGLPEEEAESVPF